VHALGDAWVENGTLRAHRLGLHRLTCVQSGGRMSARML
jgi:hypothetical protein